MTILRAGYALLFATTMLAWRPAAKAGGDHPQAPDWQLRDLAGQVVKLGDYKGKVVILNFWATWCPPCREEIPGFIRLQKKYGAKGMAVIGICMDEGEAKSITAFAQKLAINYPVVRGDEKVAFTYGGIQTIPTTFVIDRAGKIAAAHGGGVPMATFEADLKPLL